MKVYTKVVFNWNPDTEQYEETYAETYDYHGEVGYCQRLGDTGYDLNEILDRIITGVEGVEGRKEGRRQFDITRDEGVRRFDLTHGADVSQANRAHIMRQRELELEKENLSIQRQNAKNTEARIRQAGEEHAARLDDRDAKSDHMNLTSIVSAGADDSYGAIDAKIHHIRALLEGPRPLHPEVIPQANLALHNLESTRMELEALDHIFSDSGLSANDIRQVANSGVAPTTDVSPTTPYSGMSLSLSQNQRARLMSHATTIEKTAQTRRFKEVLISMMKAKGADMDSPDAKQVLTLAEHAPERAYTLLQNKIGSTIPHATAWQGMSEIEASAGLSRQSGQDLESMVTELKQQGVSASDINLYRLYDGAATRLAFTTETRYTNDELNKLITWASETEKLSIEKGTISPERANQPMTAERAVRLAEKSGATVDSEGNVIITPRQRTGGKRTPVQGVTQGDSYMVQNQFRNAFGGKGALINIVHSKNSTGTIQVESIGPPPGGPTMDDQEQYVYFLDSSTSVRHHLPISIFKQNFVKVR